MPWFEIHTKENVHGVYFTQASDVDTARRMFENGEVTKPAVYEASDVEIENVKAVDNE